MSKSPWQANQEVNVDAYIEKFQPSIFSNPETPYNPISDNFTVYDRYRDVQDQFNWGVRVQWQGSQWSLEAMAGRRFNPWGAFRWTPAGLAPSNPAFITAVPTATELTKNTTGTQSAYEWYRLAGDTRLSGYGGYFTSLGFPADVPEPPPIPEAGTITALNGLSTYVPTGSVNTGGGLRGYIERRYFHEYNLGLGVGYTTIAAPSSFWNQILIHLEVRYTPDRTLSQIALEQGFYRTNDWVGALVMEKYYRFSAAFPATYFVLQYMHRTRTDLFGRALAGYGAQPYYPKDPAGGDFSPTQRLRPTGLPGGANYVAFAFTQPFPHKVWQAAFAALLDTQGGILVQPGVQWTPSSRWRATLFYNYVNGHLGGNPNKNLFGTASEYANEVTLRVQFQF